jgi:hypothetical protein
VRGLWNTYIRLCNLSRRGLFRHWSGICSPVGGVPAGRGATVSLPSPRYMLLSARPFVLVLGLTVQFGCWHRGAAGTVGHRGSGTQGRGLSGSGAGVFWLVMVGNTRVRNNRNCCAEGCQSSCVPRDPGDLPLGGAGRDRDLVIGRRSE